MKSDEKNKIESILGKKYSDELLNYLEMQSLHFIAINAIPFKDKLDVQRLLDSIRNELSTTEFLIEAIKRGDKVERNYEQIRELFSALETVIYEHTKAVENVKNDSSRFWINCGLTALSITIAAYSAVLSSAADREIKDLKEHNEKADHEIKSLKARVEEILKTSSEKKPDQ